MTDETIQILQRRIVEARPFYANRTDEALKNCKEQGYEALYMPEVLDARTGSDKDHFVWKHWFKAPSIRATGRTKQGNAVVVYAHIPNYFSDAENITKAIVYQGLRSGAGKIPSDEFQRLLDLQDDNLVFVIDYATLKNSFSGVISIKEARKHPQTIPFCGGEKRAEEYLLCHERVYGNKIGNWHSDDLHDEPFGRLLIVGDCNFGYGYGYDVGLDGGGDFGRDARFLGVRSSTGEASAQKIFPSKEKLAEIINEYVPTIIQKDAAERVNSLYI